MKDRKNGKGYRWLKLAGLTALLALCLTLSACYIPPDEISNTQNMTIGSDNLPFQTVAPQVTNTPTPTPATVVIGQNTDNPPVNPDDGWAENVATNTPPPTITVTTKAPTDPPTERPTATPTPTTTSNVLKKGATGSRVREVQQRLKDLGYYNGSVDGSFGEGTENAIKAFQSANGLRADGVVGDKTLSKLYDKNAKPYASGKATPTPKKANTPTRTNTPRPTATPNLTKPSYLQIGSSGKKVRTLQNRLIQLGWMAGKADGEYSGATQAAVMAFQKKTSGLYADGIAGPETQASLYSASAAKSSTPVSSTGETLRQGAEGGAVRALQKQLKALGYYHGTVDGSYGAATVEAVKAFQRNNGLTADVVAGSTTLNKLYGDGAVGADGTAGSVMPDGVFQASGENSTGFVTLRAGDSGAAVQSLQERLKALGFYSKKVDGNYGSGTVAAVKAFQDSAYLRADGVAGPATQRALYGYHGSTVYATLRENSEGVQVSDLQHALYELGYYDDAINGVYGQTTMDAVRAFQLTNHMEKVDGVAGNATLQLLYSASAKGATAPNTVYSTVRSGDMGDPVVELQDVLHQLGYINEVTGVYDSSTTAAVKNFQRNNGLDVDGVAGAATQKLLYSGSPVPNY